MLPLLPCCSSHIPTMPLFSLISNRLQPLVFVRSEVPLPSTPGSDQCSLSRSLVMRCAEPLGATHIPILPPQEKPATSPIKPPSTSYTHPPSDLEQSSHIQTSSLTLCTQSPWRSRGETRKDCFLIAGKRKKGGRFLKYLAVKRSRWNEEVLFCFIFDVGKLRRYTGLPFKSQRCHSQWEFTVTPCMTFSRLLRLGKDKGMFTWHLLRRERPNLCSKLLFNSKKIRALQLLKSVDQDLHCVPDHRTIIYCWSLNLSVRYIKIKEQISYWQFFINVV